MAVFCSSLTSCFPGMLLTYFLNDFEIAPVAPIITGIALCGGIVLKQALDLSFDKLLVMTSKLFFPSYSQGRSII